MPIHNWTLVNAGVFDHFAFAWLMQLEKVLNNGILPAEYSASVELAIEGVTDLDLEIDTGIDAAITPPATALRDALGEPLILARQRRRLVIRTTADERAAALLEIIAPGTKASVGGLNQFLDNAVAALEAGCQLLVIDLFAPGPIDPRGMHGALWTRLGGSYEQPEAQPLTLAAYAAGGGGPVNCYVEPTAIGSAMIDMPLFLSPQRYVNVPLEQTYLAAFESVPKRWKRAVEGLHPTDPRA